MARKEPELFYHPVVGALSPASMMLLNLNAFRPQKPDPVSFSPLHLAASPIKQDTLTQRRKNMTLSKTAVCAVSGEILPTSEMIRFVISPDHKVVADLTEKLPGTFLWVSSNRQIIKKAIWRNCFAGKAMDTVEIPENLLEIIENGLKNRALQSLSLAKRAGELTFGFTKVDEALRSHSAYVYVVAQDSSENGREKLERLAIHQNLTIIDCWSSTELSSSIGEQNVNHLCLKRGGLAQNVLELVQKLNAVRSEK